ncbi:MAG: zinc-ribbon domain-containing protein [Candidatus Hodarchaeales archaeon]|jgi:hypothetical protein
MYNKLNLIILISILLTSFSIIIPTMAHGDSSDSEHSHDGMGMMNFNLFSSTFMLMMILGMGFQLLLAYLVYQDAMNKNISNPLLWSVLVFFTSFFGLIIYFLLISPSKPNPNMSSTVDPNFSKLKKPDSKNSSSFNENQKIIYCKTCGTSIESDALFCSNCGTPL